MTLLTNVDTAIIQEGVEKALARHRSGENVIVEVSTVLPSHVRPALTKAFEDRGVHVEIQNHQCGLTFVLGQEFHRPYTRREDEVVVRNVHISQYNCKFWIYYE